MWRRVFHRALAMVLFWRMRRAKRLAARLWVDHGDRDGAKAALDDALEFRDRAMARDRRARGGRA